MITHRNTMSLPSTTEVMNSLEYRASGKLCAVERIYMREMGGEERGGEGEGEEKHKGFMLTCVT